MANPILDLFARLRAKDDTPRVLRSAEKRFGSLGDRIRKIFTPLRGIAGASLFVGIQAGIAAVRKLGQSFGWIVGVNRETQTLRASLETVTGSASAARSAFADLDEFATETPFQVEALAQAYVRLKALGLDPSIDALRSYGNTAAVMGRRLENVVEAVADAVTGEFERLKEFGILARSTEDTVKLTFQGVTTEIGKNAEEIEEYLRNIGDINFAGGMKRQMDTLGGAFSNLQVAQGRAARAFGESGFNDSLQDLATSMTKVVEQSGPFLSFLGKVVAIPLRGAAAVTDFAASVMRAFNVLGGDTRPDTIKHQIEVVEALLASATGPNPPFAGQLLDQHIKGLRGQLERLRGLLAGDPARVLEARLDADLAETGEFYRQLEEDQAEAEGRLGVERRRAALVDEIERQRRNMALAEERKYRDGLREKNSEIEYAAALRQRPDAHRELLEEAHSRGVRTRILPSESLSEFEASDRLTPEERNTLRLTRLDLGRKRAEEDATAAMDKRKRAAKDLGRLLAAEAARRHTSYEREIAAAEEWKRQALQNARVLGIADEEYTQWVEARTQQRINAAKEEHAERQRIAAEEAALEARRRALAASDSPTDGIREGLRRFTEDTRSAAEEWAEVTEQAAQRMSASLTEFVRSGKLNFGGLVDYIIQESIRLSVVDPLIKGLANFFAGPAVSAAGLTTAQHQAIRAHSGGIVGEGALRWPRFHRGGLASDEVPAILQRGEGVFTRPQMAALAPAAPVEVTVEVVNRTPRPVAATQGGQRMDGRRLVVGVVLDEMEPGGAISKALTNNFGLRPSAA